MYRVRVLVLLNLLCMPYTNATTKYVIGLHNAGFFAAFSGVLNHLVWCDRNNLTPVVYWNSKSRYYKDGGFNGSTNVWEYYFEPVSHLRYVPGDVVHDGYCMDKISFLYYWFSKDHRELAHYLISKYVRIKPIVQAKIDTFYQEKMLGKKTIGIHLRGTDKWSEEKLVSARKMAEVALRYADSDMQFLIASDQQSLFNELKILLRPYPVIYYDCYRSPSNAALHVRTRPSYAQLGEDVLVEASLLARCDMLVRTASSVSTGSLYFNPNLAYVTVAA